MREEPQRKEDETIEEVRDAKENHTNPWLLACLHRQCSQEGESSG